MRGIVRIRICGIKGFSGFSFPQRAFSPGKRGRLAGEIPQIPKSYKS